MPSLVAIGAVVVEICFQFVTWSWRDDVTSTCLISLIWLNCSRCTCLPNLVVIGLIEMEISILISIFAWRTWKNLAYCLDPPYSEIFKIGNTDLQFRSPLYDSQKNEKKKNTGNCKALCVSRTPKQLDKETFKKLLCFLNIQQELPIPVFLNITFKFTFCYRHIEKSYSKQDNSYKFGDDEVPLSNCLWPAKNRLLCKAVNTNRFRTVLLPRSTLLF